MADAYVLSQSDVERLREVVRQVLGERMSNPVVSRRQDRSAAPEVYVARTPTGGIAALQSDVGTGTGDPSLDQPGSAECEIYQIVPAEASGDVPSMMPVDGLTQTVYNLTDSDVTGNSWVTVVRDKFGAWLVVPTGIAAPAADRIVDVVHMVDENGTASGTSGGYAQRVVRSGSGWVVADPSVTYADVIEINGLPFRYLDTDATPGATALAVTTLFQDINGRYYVDYPYLSDSDTFQTVATWTTVCNADGTFTTVPATYQTVTVSWDNHSDFPRIKLTVS